MNTQLLWWGYVHTSGTLHVKRYFGPQDLEEASESPFVFQRTGAFEAEGRTDAIKKTCEKLGVVYNPNVHK
jgi:hypothetical protein